MKAGILALVLFLFSLPLLAGEAVRISPHDAQKLLGQPGIVVLDLRTSGELSQGMLPGAKQMDFYDPQFGQKLSELDRNQTYLIYCAVGGRSGAALQAMAQMGFAKVYDLEGGFRAWSSQGMPTQKP